jgi:putative peptidoglycan lipid II flippase
MAGSEQRDEPADSGLMNSLKTKTSHSLFKASAIVTVIILFGKVIGFARDAVIAAFYGATSQTDAFFFAQSMPAMIFPAVCNSLSTAFVSLYVSRTIEHGEAEGDKFASRMLVATLALALGLSVVALVLTPWIVPLFAPGFRGDQLQLAIHLTQLTMGAFVFTMAQYMLAAILNSKRFYYGSQIAALGYNLTVIVITMGLGQAQGVDALTLTVIFGHVVQVVMLAGFAWHNFKFTWRVNPVHGETGLLIRLALPILLGNSIVSINNIVDKLLASLLATGSVSALSYSSSLNRFVTGVFITTLSTVIYPALSTSFAQNDRKTFDADLLNSLVLMPMLILPVSLITTLYANEIVAIVYQRGSFDAAATQATAEALRYYGGMYVFIAIQEVIIRAFYALKDSKTPMVNAAIAVLANSVMSVFLAQWIGIGGIALGTTLSTLLTAWILWVSLGKKLPDLNLRSIVPTFLKMGVAGAVLLVGLLGLQAIQLGGSSAIGRFVSATLVGFTLYFGILLGLKTTVLMQFGSRLKRALSTKNRKR